MNSIQNVDTLFASLKWVIEKAREQNEDGSWKWDVSDKNIYFPTMLYGGSLVDIRLVEAEKPVVVAAPVEKAPTQTDIITQELIAELPAEVTDVAIEPPVPAAPRRGGRPRK